MLCGSAAGRACGATALIAGAVSSRDTQAPDHVEIYPVAAVYEPIGASAN
ncbi:hypothetical protein [Gordonia rhizosphera]|nr:hypothetical protein [Gordonia rhizosphera]